MTYWAIRFSVPGSFRTATVEAPSKKQAVDLLKLGYLTPIIIYDVQRVERKLAM